VRALNDITPSADAGSCVVYVMARDQRLRDNHALAAAQRTALDLGLPMLVVFCLQPSTGYRAREQYDFMLAGLRKVETDLQAKRIGFSLLVGMPRDELPKAFAHVKPAAVYFDMNPLRGPRQLHQAIARRAGVAVYEVDTHNVVPVWEASHKQEFGARTLRRRIMSQLADRMQDEVTVRPHPHVYDGPAETFASMEKQVDRLLDELPRNGTDISRFNPGEAAARRAVKQFIAKRLQGYADGRNDIAIDGQSELNPYLHYGQLASLYVIRAVEEAAQQNPGLRVDADALIEEMVVRKELSDNFCFYNAKYDQLAGAPEWGRKALEAHRDDPRPRIYSQEQFERAETHDDAWNAAQRQLLRTGKMHGYMRMYWAKKVLEWSASPEEALQILLYLNDRYHIDGGDPNGYVGILWSIAGLHDRPWFERPVYGQVRYMNANGLKRKFDLERYLAAHLRERVGLDA
jgi:deoxyribodipyrimidine photo-lyase